MVEVFLILITGFTIIMKSLFSLFNGKFSVLKTNASLFWNQKEFFLVRS